jgi:hypothetical protein
MDEFKSENIITDPKVVNEFIHTVDGRVFFKVF